MATRTVEVRVYATDGTPYTTSPWSGPVMKKKEVGQAAASVTPTHTADGVWSVDISDQADTVVYWGGTGVTADHAMYLRGNVTHLIGQDLTTNAAILNLKQLNVVNDAGIAGVFSGTTGGLQALASAGSGFKAAASAGNNIGLECVGNGTGAGLQGTGGANGDGIKGSGAGTGCGMFLYAGSSAVGFRSQGNGALNSVGYVDMGTPAEGMKAYGFGSGNGLVARGGATGNGLVGLGAAGATTGHEKHGFLALGGTDANGFYSKGLGTGDGIRAYGISGIQGQSAGGGAGIHGLGNANTPGIRAGGGSGAPGFIAIGTGAAGIRTTGGTDSPGLEAIGTGSGSGIHTTGGTSGWGIKAYGGSAGGHGAGFVSQSGADGINATGHGIGAGLKVTGGASGNDLQLTSTKHNIFDILETSISAVDSFGKYIKDKLAYLTGNVALDDTVAKEATLTDATNGLAAIKSRANAIQTTVDGISNVTRISSSLPRYIRIPTLGEPANSVLVECAYKDSSGQMDDPVDNKMLVSIYASDGNPATYNDKLYQDQECLTPLIVDPGTGLPILVRSELGLYKFYFKVASTETDEEITIKFQWSEDINGSPFVMYELRDSQLANFSGELGQIYQGVLDAKASADSAAANVWAYATRELSNFGFDVVDESVVAEAITVSLMQFLSTGEFLSIGPGVGAVRFDDVLTGIGGVVIRNAVVRAFPYDPVTHEVDYTDVKGSCETADDGSYHLNLDPGTYARRVWKNGVVVLDDLLTVSAQP